MHRRRQNDNEFDDIPVLTDSIDEFDDIPVLTVVESEPVPEAAQAINETNVELTEAVGPIESAEIPRQASPEHPPAIDPAWRDQLVHDLASRIEERIKAALPEIINSTISDFLADQEMIANS
jgi:hypothetical protein